MAPSGCLLAHQMLPSEQGLEQAELQAHSGCLRFTDLRWAERDIGRAKLGRLSRNHHEYGAWCPCAICKSKFQLRFARSGA